jgi:hypothetical protein
MTDFVPSPQKHPQTSPLTLPHVDSKTFGLYALFENLLKDDILSLETVYTIAVLHVAGTDSMALSIRAEREKPGDLYG